MLRSRPTPGGSACIVFVDKLRHVCRLRGLPLQPVRSPPRLSPFILARQDHLFLSSRFLWCKARCVFASRKHKRIDLANAHWGVCVPVLALRVLAAKNSLDVFPLTRSDLAQRGLEPGGPSVPQDQARQRELPAGAGALRGRHPDPPVVWLQDAGGPSSMAGSSFMRVLGGASPGGDAGDEEGSSWPPPHRPAGFGRRGFFSWDARVNAERRKLMMYPLSRPDVRDAPQHALLGELDGTMNRILHNGADGSEYRLHVGSLGILEF